MDNIRKYLGVIISIDNIPEGYDMGALSYDTVSKMEGSFITSAYASHEQDAIRMMRGDFFFQDFAVDNTISRYREATEEEL
jgi:hypothetical protein